jgi:hypothetical protein
MPLVGVYNDLIRLRCKKMKSRSIARAVCCGMYEKGKEPILLPGLSFPSPTYPVHLLEPA